MARRRNWRNTPGSESAGYHGAGVPQHPAPTKTPTVAPSPSQAATSPAGDYAGAGHEYTQAVASLPKPARTATTTALRTSPTTNPLTSRYLLHEINDLLTPGPTAKETAESAARLGVKPQSSALLSVADKAVSNIADTFAKDAHVVTQTPKLPNERHDNILGTPTPAQLVSAGQKGQLRMNQRGKVTIPQTRRVARHLQAARQEVAQSGKLTGPLTHGQRVFSETLSRLTGMNPRVIAAQALAEESSGAAAQREAEGNHDWLNIGYNDSGPLPLTKGSVWSTPESAAHATAEFLKGQKFGASSGIQNILASVKSPPAKQIQAIADSGWATNPAYGQSIAATFQQIGITPTDPEAIAALQKAKGEAHNIGIPTKAGDVEPGPAPKTVYVRADAKGFVDWAKALLGTQEGSRLQLKWAAEAGISAAEPWCAAFITAGIARRGLTPPPGSANSQSWMTWNQGTNIGTDVTKAKPGDIIVIGAGDHIGLYTGGGNMIAGNWSNEVAEYPVASDTRGIEGIIRPRFSGKKVAVQESTVLPGAAIGPGGAIVSGPVGSAEAVGGPSAPQQRRPAAPIALGSIATPGAAAAALPAAFQQFQEGAAPEPEEEGIGGLIDSILKRRRA